MAILDDIVDALPRVTPTPFNTTPRKKKSALDDLVNALPRATEGPVSPLPAEQPDVTAPASDFRSSWMSPASPLAQEVQKSIRPLPLPTEPPASPKSATPTQTEIERRARMSGYRAIGGPVGGFVGAVVEDPLLGLKGFGAGVSSAAKGIAEIPESIESLVVPAPGPPEPGETEITPFENPITKMARGIAKLIGKAEKEWIPPDDLQDDILKNPAILSDPRWWIYHGGTIIGSMAPFMLGGIGGAHAGVKIAKMAQWSPKSTELAKRIGGVAASSVSESLVEAGNAYREIIQKGDTKENAASAAARVFSENVTLTAVTSGTTFFGGHEAATRGGKALNWLSQVASEATQEAAQEKISTAATGEELTPGQTAKAALLGAVGGGVGGPIAETAMRTSARIPKPPVPTEATPEAQTGQKPPITTAPAEPSTTTMTQAQASSLGRVAPEMGAQKLGEAPVAPVSPGAPPEVSAPTMTISRPEALPAPKGAFRSFVEARGAKWDDYLTDPNTPDHTALRDEFQGRRPASIESPAVVASKAPETPLPAPQAETRSVTEAKEEVEGVPGKPLPEATERLPSDITPDMEAELFNLQAHAKDIHRRIREDQKGYLPPKKAKAEGETPASYLIAAGGSNFHASGLGGETQDLHRSLFQKGLVTRSGGESADVLVDRMRTEHPEWGIQTESDLLELLREGGDRLYTAEAAGEEHDPATEEEALDLLGTKELQEELRKTQDQIKWYKDRGVTARRTEAEPEPEREEEKSFDLFYDPKDSRTPHVAWDKVKKLGTTENIEEAGFIDPEGKLIDLSPKIDSVGLRTGGPREGPRYYPHEIVGKLGPGSMGTRWIGLQEFLGSGYIRIDSKGNGIEIKTNPTDAQLFRLKAFLQSRNDQEISIDIQDGWVHPNEPQPTGRRPGFSKTYSPKTNPAHILNDIRVFYAGGQPVESLGRRFHHYNPRVGEENLRRFMERSKVVNKEGEPLVVYHGTAYSDWTEFDANKTDLGLHMTPVPDVASYMAGRRAQGARVYPFYVSMKNPLRLIDRGSFQPETVLPQLEELGIITKQEIDITHRWNGEDVRNFLIEKGYDGVVYLNRREVIARDEGESGISEGRFFDVWSARNLTDEQFKNKLPMAEDSYIAFSPTQIKSATGNRGTFDPTNPDIVYYRPGEDVKAIDPDTRTEPASQKSAGTEAILDRLDIGVREQGLDPTVAEAGRAFVETLDRTGYLADLEVRVGPEEGPQARYTADMDAVGRRANALVELFSRSATDPRASVHDLAHHLEQFVPEEDMAPLRDRYEREKAAYEKRKTTMAALARAGRGEFTSEASYRYRSFSEYFAERVADIELLRQGKLKAEANASTWIKPALKMKHLLQTWWGVIRDTWKGDVAAKIYRNLQLGRYGIKEDFTTQRGPDVGRAYRQVGRYETGAIPAEPFYSHAITPEARDQVLYQGQPTYYDPKNREENLRRFMEESEVVDKNGKPLVVYHGTSGDFDEITPFSHFGTAKAANDRIEGKFGDEPPPGVSIMSGYLNLKNPLRISDPGEAPLNIALDIEISTGEPVFDKAVSEWTRTLSGSEKSFLVDYLGVEKSKNIGPKILKMAEEGVDKFDDIMFMGDVRENKRAGKFEVVYREIKSALEEKGYDGLVYRNDVEDSGEDTYINLYPEQFKSATGNKGVFDPTKQSMLDYDPKTEGDIPKPAEKEKLPPGIRERQLPKSLEAAEQFGGYERTYRVATDVEARRIADERLKDPDAAYIDLTTKPAWDKPDMVTALSLAGYYGREGRRLTDEGVAAGDTPGAGKRALASTAYNQQIALTHEASQKATTHGQATQALSMVSMLDPDGVLIYAQRKIDELNEGKRETRKQTLSPEEAARLQAQAAHAQIWESLGDRGREIAQFSDRVFAGQPLSKDEWKRLKDLFRAVQVSAPKRRSSKLPDLSKLGMAEGARQAPALTAPRSAAPRPPSISERVTSRLDASATAARQRRAERRGQIQALVDPADIADAVIIGAAELGKKGITFAQWSSTIVGEFGDGIQDHLQGIHAKSRVVYRQARDMEILTNRALRKLQEAEYDVDLLRPATRTQELARAYEALKAAPTEETQDRAAQDLISALKNLGKKDVSPLDALIRQAQKESTGEIPEVKPKKPPPDPRARARARLIKRAETELEATDITAQDALHLATAVEKLRSTIEAGRMEAAAEVSQAIAMLEKPTFMGKFGSIYMTNMLSGTKTLLTRNPLGNEILYRFGRIGRFALSPTIDRVVSRVASTGERTVVVGLNTQGFDWGALLRGDVKGAFTEDSYWTGLVDGARRSWKGLPATVKQTEKFETGRVPQFRGKGWIQKGIEATTGRKVETDINLPATYTKTVTTVLDAFDNAGWVRARNTTLGDMAKAAWFSAGKPDNKRAFVENYLKNIPPEALTWAESEANYYTLKDPTILSSVLIGAKKLLNLEPAMIGMLNQKAGEYLKSKGWKGAFGLGTIEFPFGQVPGSLIMKSIDYSPIGILRGMYILSKGVAKGRLGADVEFSQRETVKAITNGITGTVGFTLLGYWMASLGLIGGGDDEWQVGEFKRQQTGEPRNLWVNPDATRRWVMSGFNPEAARRQEGDAFFTLDWMQPAAVNLGMAVETYNRIREKGGMGTLDLSQIAGEALAAGAETMLEVPMLQMIRRTLRPTQDSESALKPLIDALEGVPSTLAAPSILNEVRQMVDNQGRVTTDPTPYQRAINRALYRLPWLSKTLPVAYKTLGEDMPKEVYQDGRNTLFNVFLNPGFISTYHVDPMVEMLLRPYEDAGEKKQIPETLKPKQEFSAHSLNRVLFNNEKVFSGPVTIYLAKEDLSDLQRIAVSFTTQKLSSVETLSPDPDKVAQELSNLVNKAAQEARDWFIFHRLATKYKKQLNDIFKKQRRPTGTLLQSLAAARSVA